MYTVALVGASQINVGLDDQFAALDAVEPGNHISFSQSGILPAVIVSITPNYVFVSIAGTNSWIQWVANFLGSAQATFPDYPGFTNIYWTTATNLMVASILRPLLPFMATRFTVFMGHSLGGAIAQLMASNARLTPNAGIACFVLGCPRVGNQTFADSVGPKVFRCEDTYDPICSVPPPSWPLGPVGWFQPPPLPQAGYVHGGEVKTLDAAGNLSDGHTEIDFSDVLAAFYNVSMPSHLSQEYVRRLAIGITPSDLDPVNSKYHDPAALGPIFRDLFPFGSGSGGGFLLGEEMVKFTLFYNIGTRAGVTESFFTTQSSASYTSILSDYLMARMALAQSYFVFKYARISNVQPNRKVSWRVASDVAVSAGTAGLAGGNAAPEQALLYRMTMTDGSNGRIFLHGFPDVQFNGENYTPTPSFKIAVSAFTATLANGSYLYQSLLNPHTVAQRVGIGAYTASPPRGTTLTLTESLSISPGAIITIGGSGPAIVGLNGRKVVISSSSPTSVTIGGATPIGNPTSLSLGCYLYTDQFQYLTPNFAAVESLTTHRVGRPFGVRPGRRHNLVTLR